MTCKHKDIVPGQHCFVSSAHRFLGEMLLTMLTVSLRYYRIVARSHLQIVSHGQQRCCQGVDEVSMSLLKTYLPHTLRKWLYARGQSDAFLSMASPQLIWHSILLIMVVR
jgi:hypothetical protein